MPMHSLCISNTRCQRINSLRKFFFFINFNLKSSVTAAQIERNSLFMNWKIFKISLWSRYRLDNQLFKNNLTFFLLIVVIERYFFLLILPERVLLYGALSFINPQKRIFLLPVINIQLIFRSSAKWNVSVLVLKDPCATIPCLLLFYSLRFVF